MMKPSFWRFQKPLIERCCRVVFAGPHFPAGLRFTRERVERGNHRLELIHAQTDDELFQVAPVADVALPFMQKFPAEFLQKASQLRLVMQFGVGLEGVDVEEATRQGIAVSNIPAADTGNAQATAEHALFLSLSLLRHSTHELPRRFQNRELGGWPAPRALYRKRVTVVGYGAVGSTLTEYLTTMGAEVTVVRRNWGCEDGASESFVRSACLEETLPTTELLILACTMTPETFHLMNESTLSLLQSGALVVNVGRGPLVEHGAILKSLQSGVVAGFASDVGVGHPSKPSEPWDPADELSQHPCVLFTPHVGGYTEYSYDIMAGRVMHAIEDVIHGRPPAVWVNRPSGTQNRSNAKD